MKKMDLKQMVSDVEEDEKYVSFIVYVPKSQKDNMKKLSENLIKKKVRGKLSVLCRRIFKKVIEDNKAYL